MQIQQVQLGVTSLDFFKESSEMLINHDLYQFLSAQRLGRMMLLL